MTPRDIALASLPPALWAITYVIAKPATAHFPPLFLVAMVYALTAAMLVLAFAGYALPYSIWYGLMRRYRVDQVAPFALLMPITGVLASAAFLGERLSLLSVLGGVIILFGLALVAGMREGRGVSADLATGRLDPTVSRTED